MRARARSSTAIASLRESLPARRSTVPYPHCATMMSSRRRKLGALKGIEHVVHQILRLQFDHASTPQ